jgi:TPR repeat protein
MNYLSQRHICESIGSIHDPSTEYLETDVLDMFNNKNPNKYEDTTDPKLMTWIATYYDNVEKNEEKMLKFLINASNLGDSNALNNLGCFYFEKGHLSKARQLWQMSGNSQKNLDVLDKLESVISQMQNNKN